MENIQIVSLKVVNNGELKNTYDMNIKNPNDVYELIKDYIGNEDREHFIILGLNAKSQVNIISTISIGTLTSSLVHPREVFKIAILSNCYKIILAHNHPSGNLTPSTEDLKVTERLKKVGEIIGIEILDHIIVSESKYYSFKENMVI